MLFTSRSRNGSEGEELLPERLVLGGVGELAGGIGLLSRSMVKLVWELRITGVKAMDEVREDHRGREQR